jgi:hypothetical protein
MELQDDELALRRRGLKLRLGAMAEKLVANIEDLTEPKSPLEAERMAKALKATDAAIEQIFKGDDDAAAGKGSCISDFPDLQAGLLAYLRAHGRRTTGLARWGGIGAIWGSGRSGQSAGDLYRRVSCRRSADDLCVGQAQGCD